MLAVADVAVKFGLRTARNGDDQQASWGEIRRSIAKQESRIIEMLQHFGTDGELSPAGERARIGRLERLRWREFDARCFAQRLRIPVALISIPGISV